MSNIKAIIFDLDGVIVSTDHFHYLAWKTLADDLGIFFDETINNKLRGVSRMESLEIILRSGNMTLSNEEKVRLTEKKNDIYKVLLQQLTPQELTPDVNDTLHALKDMGLKLAIGSSSKNAKPILSLIGLEGFFAAISDGNNISNSKPDPEVFVKAAEYISEKPENCLVVEDAIVGIIAGQKAGMKTIAIGDARNSEIADYRVNKFSEILDIVKDLL